MTKLQKIAFKSEHFTVSLEDDYIFEIIRGKVSVSEAQEAANAVMDLARAHDCRNLMVDVSDMGWISDINLRNKGMDIVATARNLFDKSAVVTPSKPIRYLVVGIMKGGGLRNVRGFITTEEATAWLISP